MSSLLKLLVMSLAELIEKAFLADPNYVPKGRHLVRFTRVDTHTRHLTDCTHPENPEVIAGLKS